MSNEKKRVTLQDIADATGYTVNTVSRALKNKDDISRETCEMIQKKAHEMGYVRNYLASSLRSGRTKTLAMIAGSMINPFYAILADLIQQEAVRLGYSLIILCSRDDSEAELHAVEMALSRQVDGILITPCSFDSPALATLRSTGVPYVLLSRYQDNTKDDCVYCNDSQGGYLAGRYLLESGHRKLAMLSYRPVVFSSKERFSGFRRAWDEAGIPETDVFYGCPDDPAGILPQLLSWLKQGVTGLFSFCDVEAWNTITLLDGAGFHVPEDLTVIGFDNILRYIRFPKPISSVDCHLQEEACAAIDFIRKRIHDPSLPPQQLCLPVSLILR
ncbi:MAG: LacI family DNA-binding transcriptional regulator [Parasporobacterium sp.]|nr:LacI family DNA-binding transcriptional regulator [Parasporobacterium sp.]